MVKKKSNKRSILNLNMGNIDGMPEYTNIPQEYRGYSHPWAKIVSKLFFNGGSIAFEPKDTCKDPNQVKQTLRSWMCSFEPQHERKVAACAQLLDENFHLPIARSDHLDTTLKP